MTEVVKGQLISPGFLKMAALGRSPSELNPASWAHERIVRSIAKFEERLDDAQEIGARLVSFSSREVIQIDDVGFWGPDIVIFYGKNAEGHPVELLQHVSQTNVLLVAVPKTGNIPRRIGFRMVEELSKKSPAAS